VLSVDQAAAIILQEEELRSWAWCHDREVAKLSPDVLAARRVATSRRARGEGAPAYLEDGFAVM